MSDNLLYLSRADVEHLAPAKNQLRDALAAAVRQTRAGHLRFLPKSTLTYAVGHSFQSMPALLSDPDAADDTKIATIKWVSVVPAAAKTIQNNIHSLICVNDLQSGRPLSIMDGNYITLIRTAALSALAAQHMYKTEPKTIGFIGCGQQAMEHLHAFYNLYPGLERVLCFSRSKSSAQNLAAQANELGLIGENSTSPDELLKNSDIVISTVPATNGLEPFLDARYMKADALAVMVDLGRSWIAEGFSAFDRIVTDSLQQSTHPYDNQGNEVTTATATLDLEDIIFEPLTQSCRQAFFFKGIASADLAIAGLIYQRAVKNACGTPLPR